MLGGALQTTSFTASSSSTSTLSTPERGSAAQNQNHEQKNANSNASADLGLIGLAVMGQNLILNMADHGFTICAFNRTVSKVDRFLANEAKGKSIVGAHSTEEFVSKLKKPRRVMLLVQAGKAVDDWIETLIPLLERGDIIIDGGNSHFPDSNRRTQYLASKGFRFVGSGVSGGEEGARYGPSMMPGGQEDAWPYIKDIFQSIAAKSDNEPCCDWVGDEGAGHYVKMVHNGIEYGDMQLISEAYDIMKRGLGLSSKEIGDVFAKWNKGVLDSFLIEITRDIMYYNDDDGTALVEKILDKAGQKGTGKWTAINALDLGMPVTLIAEAVLSRCLSAIKDERVTASKKLEFVGRANKFEGNKEQFLEDLEQALYASKIISYAQGFMLMQEAAKEYKWKLNKPSIALMWRGGCIIRSVFLKDITAAYRKDPDLQNLLFDDFFNKAIHKAQPGWRDVVAKSALLGIPTPAFSTALSWFDGYRTKDLPANLLQAQRDYFGAHTFRIKPEDASDKYPNGQDIHVNWTGRGGNVSASTYQA
ncbi:6-phosphogluconate dehydrogenase, decarboxylating 1 [Sporothrix schenckii ATCC 58251]|uniref:6-phosphogluconate dehydrogenase, decarboxylating n=1 Tax=Sporothrix schenckii (strain ATCC 58251 / de Perez 2211183) TaxID=1391915 RepID=U7PJ30_SPOS1|nr:6-phosphogluconate dehydrogenase, decarboxylating 1 [Sporothrix schenckii ATCC 58251]